LLGTCPFCSCLPQYVLHAPCSCLGHAFLFVFTTICPSRTMYLLGTCLSVHVYHNMSFTHHVVAWDMPFLFVFTTICPSRTMYLLGTCPFCSCFPRHIIASLNIFFSFTYQHILDAYCPYPSNLSFLETRNSTYLEIKFAVIIKYYLLKISCQLY
jgi:hypothetical protein